MSTVLFECVVLDCPDPKGLAAFYGNVLGWRLRDGQERDPANDWATLVNPAGGTDICFQRDPEFQPSTWPRRDRQQMLHLDLTVADLAAEHARIVEFGARLLDDRSPSFWVYADPAGHPFCLCVDSDE